MIIELSILPTATPSFSVDVLKSFKATYNQKVDYVKVASGKTRAYNYGVLADKWYSEITIQSDNASMEAISRHFLSDINQAKITCGAGEQIFGAGIDYTQPIICNVTNAEKQYSQNDIALSTIKLSLSAISYQDTTQLIYRSAITAGLPTKLNFQTPIDRNLINQESSFQSENFGTFGKITEVNSTGLPTKSQNFSIVFDQTEEEQAKIEKFVSVQRSTPFIFTEADYLYLFEDQANQNVMITGMVVTRVGHNNWRTTLKMVNNV